MISQQAFNALLKTLEEPPEYVIFILATTDIQKVPITIRSRVQRWDFHRITIETITNRMKELMEKEEVSIDEQALRYIAKCADGSMRDALSILDKSIALYTGKTITYEDVLGTLGTVDTEVFHKTLLFKKRRGNFCQKQKLFLTLRHNGDMRLHACSKPPWELGWGMPERADKSL